LVNLTVKWEGKGLDQMKQFLLAMEGKANRPAAVALTRTARHVERQVKAQAPRFIDRPTAWTMRSTFVKPARPDKLEVQVGFKDWANTGTAAADYLQPIAAGGSRPLKPFEKRLQSKGILPFGQYAAPAGINPYRLNQYGNLPANQYMQVLSRLGALRNIGTMQNATGSRRSRAKQINRPIFVTEVNGHRGIFTRNPGSREPIPVFWFIGKPSYRQSFPVQRIMQETFASQWPIEFEKAIDEEMKYWASK